MPEPVPDVRALVERVEELEARVAELEDAREDAPTTGAAGYGDHRDQAVIAALDPGNSVSLQWLRRQYRAETDITNGRTIKRRIKALTTDGPFEHVGQSVWRFTGETDD